MCRVRSIRTVDPDRRAVTSEDVINEQRLDRYDAEVVGSSQSRRMFLMCAFYSLIQVEK